MKLGAPDLPVFCSASKAATSEATGSLSLPDSLSQAIRSSPRGCSVALALTGRTLSR